MLNVKKIKKYIEKKNNITLTSMQYQILKAAVRGDVVYTARGCGRSLIYDGYADYLKNVVGKDTDRTIAPSDFDSIFTNSMIVNNKEFTKNTRDVWNRIKETNPERFDKDFECKYFVNEENDNDK